MYMKAHQLVPELGVSNLTRSLGFYTRILGFSITYQRIEEGFAFLVLGDAQIMIDVIGA
jgi:catechol 2,3-dioxygenase-like lactoylglutathione lyase family enzyme